MNRVTLYSNGTGVFDRAYVLRERQPLTVSIPIRNDSLDEAVASIGVFGDVTLTEPPSYTPIGSATGNLSLDAENVIRDLATRLRGSRVTLRAGMETISGRLAGIQTFTETVGDTTVERFRIALLDDEGAFRTYADREVTALRYTDESVQAEIDKALQRAFETIKPNSTFVNLTLVPNIDGDVEAHVQYAVAQLGAWKISYRLRGIEGAWELEGQAVVDNSTDEPWNDVLVSVLSGAPVSFATDLAEIRPVRRNRVNVVADQAIDAVMAADAIPEMDFSLAESLSFNDSASYSSGESAAPARAQVRAMRLASAPAPEFKRRAKQEQAQTREIGESVEYTAPFPVSIGANRSAIIPMFSTVLPEAKPVLIYKPERNAERGYRTLRCKNATGHPLGRGVCTVFQDGAYVGKAILESCQPDEERILPYAQETGVCFYREEPKFESRRVRLQITEGALVEEHVRRGVTRYRVRNSSANAFALEIEHAFRLPEGAIEIKAAPAGEITAVAIPDGTRIGVPLPAKADLILAVHETKVETQGFLVTKQEYGLPALSSIVTREHPLYREPAFQKCLRRQEAIDLARRELADAELQVNDILEEQERLKGLLAAGGHEGAANEWRVTLAQNERLIKEAKTTRIPQLRQSVKEAEQALQQALSALTLSWREEPDTEQ